MQIHQLRYFCAVARKKSFTKAAELEGISQPTLSQQVSKLEQHLGAALLERRGRSVGLSRAGQALLPLAEAILRHVAEAREAVECARENVAGRLIVGSIPTVTPYFLAPRIGDFRARHPDIDVVLVENITSRLEEALLDGNIDIALLSLPVHNRELIISALFRERLMLALPPNHPLKEAPELNPRDVRDERFLVLREGHCFREDALAVCRHAQVDRGAVFESDQFASIFALIEGGFGVSVAPEMAAAAAGRCRFIPLRPEAVRRIGYAQRRRPFVPPAQKAFIRWLREMGNNVALSG